jgi:hypothetical protein
VREHGGNKWLSDIEALLFGFIDSLAPQLIVGSMKELNSSY